MDYQLFIKQELAKAMGLAGKHFGKVSSSVKPGDSNQVLTEADLAIGKQLVAAVQAAYPDHNIIDEEFGVVDKGSLFTWVIDPIDGTSNFAAGLPHYGIFLGLLSDGEPIAGGAALPAFGEIYVAEKGKGGYCNGERIRMKTAPALIDCLVAYGIDGHAEDPARTQNESALLAEIVLRIRNLRSTNSAYDAAMTARGKYAASLNQTSKIWDNVAQQVIIEEAGGVYTTFDGRAMDYTNPLARAEENFTFCMASPHIHAQLQEIIQAHGQGARA